MTQETIELEGLRVALDKLVHHCENVNLPDALSHAFIYFLSIHNLSDRTVTILGRKWVLKNDDETTTVVEGDKVVGETPVLTPGETFTYNSYHITHIGAIASGSFHGIDELGNKIRVRIPDFRLEIPDDMRSDPTLS
ncbi:MAG: magnesium transporter [Opitutae bacterium]|nr:magnesium transporter [Opitutae bacterium]